MTEQKAAARGKLSPGLAGGGPGLVPRKPAGWAVLPDFWRGVQLLIIIVKVHLMGLPVCCLEVTNVESSFPTQGPARVLL